MTKTFAEASERRSARVMFPTRGVREVVERMALFERNHPFVVADGVLIYSRWASLDAGLASKAIVARLVRAAPTRDIATPANRFHHDAGVCFERPEASRRVFDGTIVLCKNRLELAEWKTVFGAKNDVAVLERYDGGPAFQKRVVGKSVWLVSKSVFQKMSLHPARLVCTAFGMTDVAASFTWVIGFSPNARNALRFAPDKSDWLRPIVVAHRIHQLFKIPDIFFRYFNIPRRRPGGEDDDPFSCCVCYEESVDRRLRLECGHRICFACLYGCVSTGHFLCPVCRATVDRTFVTEEADADADDAVELKNYDKCVLDVLKTREAEAKWIVFQKTSQSEIGSGMYNFLYKNDGLLYASTTASHFPAVDASVVAAVVVSEEHEPSRSLLQSFLCHSVSNSRTNPLVIHCLHYDSDFIEKIDKIVNHFFSN